jgi:hypothetical protein
MHRVVNKRVVSWFGEHPTHGAVPPSGTAVHCAGSGSWWCRGECPTGGNEQLDST